MKIKVTGFIVALAMIFAGLPGAVADAAVSTWQQGISIQPTHNSDFASTSFQQSVDKAAETGVNHVTLIIPVRQSNIHSTDVAVTGDTPTDASLAAASRYIQGKGMSVAFGVHVNPNDGQWRAMINPDDRTSWFANYGAILNRYAVLAQDLGIDQYILGTELSSMTDPSVNASNTENWNAMIREVRARYSGTLTYSAQHSYYKSDLMSLGFWPQLDKIGISAYYGLSNEANPSVQSVKASWDRWNNEQVRTISQRYNKPVIFTEVGYVSRDYALQDPGSAFTLGTAYNGQIQATGYQALFEYWNEYDYMQGVSLWDWRSNPSAGGEGDRDYTPQNKPAEQVMKQWFGSATPAPVPQPTPAPSESASYTVSADLASQAVVNSPVTVATKVAASQPVSGVLVDIELYNSQGQRVHQQFFENESLGTTEKTYEVQFTPVSTGDFIVKVGVFTSGWQKNLYWNDEVQKFTVSSTTVEPAPSQPTPTQPTPTEPTPTQPTNPDTTASSTVSVWWPGDGVTVNGVQPFKAVVDGRDLSSYKMYWQVDGGVLNLMGDNADSVPHKLSYVDLTHWKWNASKQYTIRFIAHDLNGNVIGEKTVVITVS
ncbi:MAG TPA: hypothetical protein VK983_05720 [Candidatus Limnocylindrales bacterium]|nr:hypothetical protein [Candidatus Limnocylindrales bacterium]